MKYVAPAIELEVLNTEDIVMVSGVTLGTEGSLTEVEWGKLQ